MSLHSVYKVALGPILLAQGRNLKKTAVRLPEAHGARAGRIDGDNQDELKLLFVGDSTMAGVGVEHQAEALAWQTAGFVSERLHRSVRWQTLARNGTTIGQALGLVADRTDEPDVLVTAFGANDVFAQTKPHKFVAGYEALVEKAFAGRENRFSVISGLPPLHITPAVPQPLRWYFGGSARQLDRALQSWTSVQPDISFLSLQWAADPAELSKDRFHPGIGLYRLWADLVARQILRRLS